VRVSLPLMLIVSLALHVGVTAGITLSYFHSEAVHFADSPAATTPTPPVMLLSSHKAATLQQPVLAKPVVPALAMIAPVPIPSLVLSPVKKSAHPTTPRPALAMEANPNAHIKPLPPESVLSPNPAPKLDGANAVVFVLDISGSMYEPYAGSTRLAFAREELSRQIRALKDGTPFAITLYALRACNSGPLVTASAATREAAVRFITRDVDCGGGTNLPAGLASAQQLRPGSLVLATDGDLNDTAFDLSAQARTLLGPESHGPSLSIVGIAPRLDTSAEQLLQSLADQQGGTYRAEEADRDSQLVTSAVR
jgi:hypothetical protein